MVPQQRVQGEQAHTLMMGHVGVQHGVGLATPLPGRGVVDGLVQAEPTLGAGGGEPLQVLAGRLGRHHQRQCRGVGGDDLVLREAALQAQARHSEGAVLVVELQVHGVVTGLRDPPGQAALPAIGDLARHRGPGGLFEQGIGVGRHHQLRHQVLEHRPAPGEQDRLAAGAGEGAPEGEPGLLGQLSLGDGDKHAQPGLRSEQVVGARIPAAILHVVTDAQQPRRRVVEEAVLHVGRQGPDPCGQVLDGGEAGLGAFAALAQTHAELRQPGLHVGILGARAAGPRVDGTPAPPAGQGVQGRDGVEVGQVAQARGGRFQPGPWCEPGQLVTGRPALPGQGQGPPGRLRIGRAARVMDPAMGQVMGQFMGQVRGQRLGGPHQGVQQAMGRGEPGRGAGQRGVECGAELGQCGTGGDRCRRSCGLLQYPQAIAQALGPAWRQDRVIGQGEQARTQGQ